MKITELYPTKNIMIKLILGELDNYFTIENNKIILKSIDDYLLLSTYCTTDKKTNIKNRYSDIVFCMIRHDISKFLNIPVFTNDKPSEEDIGKFALSFLSDKSKIKLLPVVKFIYTTYTENISKKKYNEYKDKGYYNDLTTEEIKRFVKFYDYFQMYRFEMKITHDIYKYYPTEFFDMFLPYLKKHYLNDDKLFDFKNFYKVNDVFADKRNSYYDIFNKVILWRNKQNETYQDLKTNLYKQYGKSILAYILMMFLISYQPMHTPYLYDDIYGVKIVLFAILCDIFELKYSEEVHKVKNDKFHVKRFIEVAAFVHKIPEIFANVEKDKLILDNPNDEILQYGDNEKINIISYVLKHNLQCTDIIKKISKNNYTPAQLIDKDNKDIYNYAENKNKDKVEDKEYKKIALINILNYLTVFNPNLLIDFIKINKYMVYYTLGNIDYKDYSLCRPSSEHIITIHTPYLYIPYSVFISYKNIESSLCRCFAIFSYNWKIMYAFLDEPDRFQMNYFVKMRHHS